MNHEAYVFISEGLGLRADMGLALSISHTQKLNAGLTVCVPVRETGCHFLQVETLAEESARLI